MFLQWQGGRGFLVFFYLGFSSLTSTVSRLSRPRSAEKLAVGETCLEMDGTRGRSAKQRHLAATLTPP
jgi:hypothetical protein